METEFTVHCMRLSEETISLKYSTVVEADRAARIAAKTGSYQLVTVTNGARLLGQFVHDVPCSSVIS